MKKFFLKFKRYLVFVPVLVIVLSLPVSALVIGDVNGSNSSSVISNCTFEYINFQTFSSTGSLLATPGNDVYLYFSSNYLILNGASSDGFSGSSSYYRTFIFSITLPYSEEKQNFSMKVSSPYSPDVYDFSSGVNSFISFGSTKGSIDRSGKSLVYSIENVPGGSTLQCQVSFLNYSSNWNIFQIYFDDIVISSLGAEDIMNNQDKNTSEILNGWEAGESPDDSSINDYHEVEGELIDSTQSSAQSATADVNDSFLGSLQRNVSSLSAVSAMFSDLLLSKVPDLNSLVFFSLSLGVLPLIVGMTINGLRSRDRNISFNSKRK